MGWDENWKLSLLKYLPTNTHTLTRQIDFQATNYEVRLKKSETEIKTLREENRLLENKVENVSYWSNTSFGIMALNTVLKRYIEERDFVIIGSIFKIIYLPLLFTIVISRKWSLSKGVQWIRRI